jgi:hypothetical protein
MNNQLFFNTINQFDNGMVNFNLGIKWSFLFNRKWYPVHAFMAEYRILAGIQGEMNLHSSVNELSKFFPITTAEIQFVTYFPVSII